MNEAEVYLPDNAIAKLADTWQLWVSTKINIQIWQGALDSDSALVEQFFEPSFGQRGRKMPTQEEIPKTGVRAMGTPNKSTQELNVIFESQWK